MTLDQAIVLASAIAAVGIVWETCELVFARRTLLEDFFDWRVVRSRYYILMRHPLMGGVFDFLLTGRTFIALVVIHGLSAILVPIGLAYSFDYAWVLAAAVLFGHLCVHLRLLVGMDGADQMQTVVWSGILVYALDLGPIASTAAAVFICFQLIASYLVSGLAKLASPVWRGGTAVSRVTRAGTYCSPGLSVLLQRPAISFFFCWATIAFEVAAPLLLLAGRPGAVLMIGMGAAFHVGVALSMGLTTFVFAFFATYPVLYAMVGW